MTKLRTICCRCVAAPAVRVQSWSELQASATGACPVSIGDWRQIPRPDTTEPAGDQFAEMKWSAVFQDETLQGLIKEALTNNYDIRIAATRILEAAANLGITRANQFPQVSGGFWIANQQATPPLPVLPTFDTASIQLNWIVDFWGQYRRATEAARAILLEPTTHEM